MFSQNTPPQHIGLNITKIGTASASPASGWNGCSYGMFRSVNGFWTEAIPIASDIKTSHLCCLSLALVFDTTSPGKGGGWNRAGARHGGFTPPRISPSCPHCVILQPDGFQMLWTTLILSRAVAGQEYHYAPFRSWPRRVLPGFYRLPLLAHTGQDCMQDQL